MKGKIAVASVLSVFYIQFIATTLTAVIHWEQEIDFDHSKSVWNNIVFSDRDTNSVNDILQSNDKFRMPDKNGINSSSKLKKRPILAKNISWQEDVLRHKLVAERIIQHSVWGKAKGQVYSRLADMTDKFGPRQCGTSTLESSIDYMIDQFKADGLENVHKEPVKVPHWTRGREWATMLTPRQKNLAILGLGYSVATPKRGITASVLVVRSFEELHRRKKEAEGKIIVFNQKWESYSQSVQYRSKGASEAAKVGAVASLIRSATGFSIYSPHTGEQTYEEGVNKIPTACITVEDAEMMDRMAARKEEITVTLYMEATNHAAVQSYNTVAEIEGSVYPEEVVLVSGHLDSWDVGQGAMDDGGGAFIAWQALSLIRQLGLRPKRTMRAVLWTCEEMGIIGGQEYFKENSPNAKYFDVVMESDEGVFRPEGLQFTGTGEAMEILQLIANELLSPINASRVDKGASTPDLNQWEGVGVPRISILTENNKYFDFHHSNGDTMSVLDSHELDLGAAVWAVTAYVLADLEDMLPAHRR